MIKRTTLAETNLPKEHIYSNFGIKLRDQTMLKDLTRFASNVHKRYAALYCLEKL